MLQGMPRILRITRMQAFKFNLPKEEKVKFTVKLLVIRELFKHLEKLRERGLLLQMGKPLKILLIHNH